MTEQASRLKFLLQVKHWQTYRTFCREYDRAAAALDPQLVGTWPSRAHFYRWLSGALKGLPHPHHCRVIEAMFDGLPASQIFESLTPDRAATEFTPSALEAPTVGAVSDPLDLVIYDNLNDEDNRAISQRIRNGRNIFFVAHTGYNAMVSLYQSPMRAALEKGAVLKVVVTAPENAIMQYEQLKHRLCPSIRQEGEIREVLAACERHRAHAVRFGQPAENVQARTYLGVPSMNALLVDGWLRLIPYLPLIDAAESPVFEYFFDVDSPSTTIKTYLRSLNLLWSDSTPSLDQDKAQSVANL
ncbi:hypothetical protein GCM10010172_54540 [Paractinoplanes ferrugineus]|uniref:Uncharacterized protein n=1 Tax=Paractinoplanes ferrugineus TaxID=113564 RepID=A0A919J2G9_9ACTN|nr:hypothetical protein [Actinoplanes ferrugineus]GIE11728.1 hypothetical protein Afe05nite_35680 [Actinoplanes ferrugineus]